MAEHLAWLGLPAAVAVSFAWRAIGVAVSGRIDPNGAVFEWVRCVAFAILAGLVSRMIIFPAAILDDTLLIDRLGCVAFGILVYFVTRRNLIFGIIAAVGLFILLTAFVRGI